MFVYLQSSAESKVKKKSYSYHVDVEYCLNSLSPEHKTEQYAAMLLKISTVVKKGKLIQQNAWKTCLPYVCEKIESHFTGNDWWTATA